MSYRIITDSCADFPKELAAQLDIDQVPLTLLFRGQSTADFTDESLKEMYQGLRFGEKATTSAVNPESWSQAIGKVLAAGQDALVLAFSSGLSTTYQSAVIAAEDLLEK